MCQVIFSSFSKMCHLFFCSLERCHVGDTSRENLKDEHSQDSENSCKAVLESVTNGLDHTPLDEWTQQHLQDRTDGMYRATELARQLNVKRQNFPFVSSGTLLELEKMPPDQQLILKDLLDASSIIYGHVMAQLISNPSLPIHTPDLPPQAKLLDANTRLWDSGLRDTTLLSTNAYQGTPRQAVTAMKAWPQFCASTT